ncbi:sulfotransferase domain-containing protein [Bacillus sp. JJ1521]|uniref:sulfotransferase domain-containing protein n=1 Tax=Bacillus sp. JJ1521 TaxID=3122957 RepID=UPI002FFE1A89
MDGNLPHFLIIGAMKCGTSSLYRNLVNHPQVISASKKEVHFFDKKFDRGLDWYLNHFPLLLENTNENRQDLITGEASPKYLVHPDAPKRAYETLPNAKLIVLLRNPVDRAYSHYHHMARNRNELLSFEEAIMKEAGQLNQQMEKVLDNYKTIPTSYLTRGIYANQLERWMQYFPREQFLILKSEDFFKDTQSTFKQVTDFLGISEFDFSEHKQWNVGQYNRMEEQLREWLKLFFKPHNERLYQLLGRNLDWDE